MDAFVAIDSSTAVVSAALFVDGRATGSVVREVPTRSSGTLLELVPPLLADAGLEFADLSQGFAFGRGPGTYAGLRTCVATVGGWALPFRLPLWAIPSPFAVAAKYFAEHPAATACRVAGRARRDTLWTGTFLRDGASGLPKLERAFGLVPVESRPEADVVEEPPSAEWIGRLRLTGVASDVPLPLYMHPAVSTAPRFA